MRSKRNFFILAALTLIVVSSACVKSTTTTTTIGNWVLKSEFDGVGRSEAVCAVSSNNKVYIGLGFDGVNRLSDFWEYTPSPTQDYYTQKKSFPGVARNLAVSFSINGKVYVGLGYDGLNYLKDFWSYDPSTDTWDSVGEFPGSARYGATAFAIQNYGYVTSGYDGNYLKDFWKFDPSSNQWELLPSHGGSKRSEAVAFVIDNKAYLCTGVNNGQYVNDMWMYDPSANAWSSKRKLTNVDAGTFDDKYTTIVRMNAAAFTYGGKGYITTGITSGYVNNTWEYTPSTDTWLEKTAYEGSGREGAIGFTANDSGYVGLGKSSTLRFDDLRVFHEQETYNAND